MSDGFPADVKFNQVAVPSDAAPSGPVDATKAISNEGRAYAAAVHDSDASRARAFATLTSGKLMPPRAGLFAIIVEQLARDMTEANARVNATAWMAERAKTLDGVDVILVAYPRYPDVTLSDTCDDATLARFQAIDYVPHHLEDAARLIFDRGGPEAIIEARVKELRAWKQRARERREQQKARGARKAERDAVIAERRRVWSEHRIARALLKLAPTLDGKLAAAVEAMALAIAAEPDAAESDPPESFITALGLPKLPSID